MSLSTAELAQLRADAEAYLPDTCTIQQKVTARTTDGGFTFAYTTRTANAECRLAGLTSSQGEMLEGDKATALTRWVLTLHYDQAVIETDRIVHDGATFEISHLEDTHSNRTARRVYLRKAD